MHVCLYSCLPASISVRRFWMRSVEPGSFTLAWNWLQSWAESSSGWTTWSAFQLMSSSICCLRTGTSRYICRVWTSWTPTYCCHLSNYVYCLWVFQPKGCGSVVLVYHVLGLGAPPLPFCSMSEMSYFSFSSFRPLLFSLAAPHKHTVQAKAVCLR